MSRTPVFLSWSGKVSEQAAGVLRDYLPKIVQAIQPFYSAADIQKGSSWWNTLHEQLRGSPRKAGVFVLTPSNLGSRWMNFEAGAIAASESGRVCTLLLGVSDAEVGHPLSAFQATKLERDDFLKLVQVLNDLTAEPIDAQPLQEIFDKFWPDIEQRLKPLVEEAQKEPKATAQHAPAEPAQTAVAGQLLRIENAIADLAVQFTQIPRTLVVGTSSSPAEFGSLGSGMVFGGGVAGPLSKGLLGGVEDFKPTSTAAIKPFKPAGK